MRSLAVEGTRVTRTGGESVARPQPERSESSSCTKGAFMLNFLRPKSAFSNVVRAKRCCVHAYFRINVVSKRRSKTPKNVRLRSWLEQNADSGEA